MLLHRELVVCPQMVTRLSVGQDESLQALPVAVQEGRPVNVVAQRNREAESYATGSDLHAIGPKVMIAPSIRLSDGTTGAIAWAWVESES